MKNICRVFLALLLIVLLGACSSTVTDSESSKEYLELKLEDLKSNFAHLEYPFILPKGAKFTNYQINYDDSKIVIETNKNFSNAYFREDIVDSVYNLFKNEIGIPAGEFDIEIVSLGIPIEELVPNVYRKKYDVDKKRIFKHSDDRPASIIDNISRPTVPTAGLENKNIALWHSHGWYYNHKLDRWMWQRARLFQIVEDIGPMAFTLPYIIPMLENAGANVFIPRERDLQINEIIIDETAADSSLVVKSSIDALEIKKLGNGFSAGNLPYPGNFNPFKSGSFSGFESSSEESASINYIPTFDEAGFYGIYISYGSIESSANDVLYSVNHLGGKTDFKINQQIGGGTWIYLGRFKFAKGYNPEKGSVIVSNKSSEPGKTITFDAVRFGGGMGVVARNGSTSGKPKYIEGARYWLQYAGMPDTLVYNMNGDSLDYNDDYQSRGEWVNYLNGEPFGPNKNKNVKGLGIPIDLSLAFHTDAGISETDTTIGTLSIYSITGLDSSKTFPNGLSRFANRDFTDIMQTQIVEDIRNKYDPVWRRRNLRDARYSEASRPNVPSTLLELLSHQNFLDNIFQSDPRFRFDVSRAIYKSMLKFIAYQNDFEYVVQPLPVTHAAAVFNSEGNIKLSWQPKSDPLEPSAEAKQFIVYTRIGDGGFDNGILVDDTTFVISEFEKNVIYSFKITAVNEGGESFPSEILSVYKSDSEPVLIVNAFDRICGPAVINTPNFSGFFTWNDAGVPDKFDLSYTGMQHNFNPHLRWATDDMPGHGASYADYENMVIAGNSFDYPFIHGKAIKTAGLSFVSVSDETVADSKIDLADYKLVDFIMGEEKETSWPKEYGDSLLGKQFKTFPSGLKSAVQKYLEAGGNIFVSGSYIGSDLFINKTEEHEDVKFAMNNLKYKLDTDHAVRIGNVYSVLDDWSSDSFSFRFNTELNDKLYAVEAPDAIGPVNGSETILRYSESDTSAGIAYKNEYGVIAFGFPFESVLDLNTRNQLMGLIIKYLLNE